MGVDAQCLDPPFDELAIKRAWLAVMRELAADVSNHGRVSRSMDVNWSETLRAEWLYKLGKLERALAAQVEP